MDRRLLLMLAACATLAWLAAGACGGDGDSDADPETPPSDPSLCPATTPTVGSACSHVGLHCAYGMMTNCECGCTGWQCAV